jgi:hypothetical protein
LEGHLLPRKVEVGDGLVCRSQDRVVFFKIEENLSQMPTTGG